MCIILNVKLHIITVGKPKLPYAKLGWEEYFDRLKHYHQVRVSHLSDKQNNAANLIQAMGNSTHSIALVIDGPQLTSQELAKFLDHRANFGQELCFMIGGPEGLPDEVLSKVNQNMSFSKLTFPHDLAMVILLEALYRASTLKAGYPYHK